jgi:hypothetical protein
MYYSSRDDKKIDLYKLTRTDEDEQDSLMLSNKAIGNNLLAKLKQHFAMNPLEDFNSTQKTELF